MRNFSLWTNKVLMYKNAKGSLVLHLFGGNMRQLALLTIIAIILQPQTSFAQETRAIGRPDRDLPFADSTPFLSVAVQQGTAAPSSSCYFRLNVEPVIQASVNNQLEHLPRSGVRRFFNGVNYSFTSLVKISVANYEESVVLYSRVYRSSRSDGENHDRSLLIYGYDYPLFLLERDSNGQAEVSVSADMKNTQTFQLAGTALEAVTLGLKAVAPSAGIITTLTEESTRNVSAQIDQSAGAFMGVSAANSERHDLDVLSGSKLRVSIFGPKDEVNENKRDHLLGKWDLGFVPTFGSYFLKSECIADFERQSWNDRATAGNVLSTPLVKNVGEIGTLDSYLRQLEWWGPSLSQLNGKTANSNEVQGFCRNIIGAVGDLGFNTLDSYIAADAVSRSRLVGSAEGALMRASPSCNFLQR